MTTESDAHFAYNRPELAALWRTAREAIESPARRTAFMIALPDAATRREVAALLGKTSTVNSQRRKVVLADLDQTLRTDRFGLTLTEVLELLHGRPIQPRESTAQRDQRRRDTARQILSDALTTHNLDNAAWAEPWIDDVLRNAKINTDDLPRLAARAAAVLAEIHLPSGADREWVARGDLAARRGGGAHALDPGTPLARMVLRAAAISHAVSAPKRIAAVRALWQRCRVTLDSVSATVLSFAIPWIGDDPWSQNLRSRTALNLPTHLTLRDLAAAPNPLIEAGTQVWVCENPRLIDALIDTGHTPPLVCVSGHLTTPERILLTRLTEDGAIIRYHGDFDPDGLIITKQVLALTHGHPWRMTTEDYKRGLDHAQTTGIELPPLSGPLPATPWDPDLGRVMTRAGWAIEEEVVLDELLRDLTAHRDLEEAPRGTSAGTTRTSCHAADGDDGQLRRPS